MRRSTALTAAATIALGGVALATPAFAEEADGPVIDTTGLTPAPSEDTKQAAEAGGVVAYGTNAAGEKVVVVTADSEIVDDEKAIDAFATKAFGADVDATTVVLPSAPRAFAEGDVVGGQGYAGLDDAGYVYACSIGFSAFAPNGDPAFIGAGHCAYDQTDQKIGPTLLTIPSQEPAEGGEGYEFGENPVLLGAFGFAQFGGPNGTAGADGDVNSTDISVVDINSAGGWSMIPAVTDWTTAGETLHSLADSAIPVKAVGAPIAGEVSKAGRTTGFSTGVIDGDDLLDGWADIDGRWVRGFSSNTLAAPGDSGGSVIQGNTAVGVISGGIEGSATAEQWTWATSLVHGLEFLDGYEVALDLDAPTATPASGSSVEPGTTITVSAPGATSVTVNGDSYPVEGGEATFPAPEEEGEYDYTLVGVNGHSTSEEASYSITVEAAPIEAPVVTSPEDGAEYTSPVTSVNGTGVAGATVTVTVDGASVGTATVDADGNWVLDGLDLGYGAFTIVATQELDGETSREASVSFEVAPAAPAVTNPSNGDTFELADFPITFEGTGVPGAEVTLELSDIGSVTVEVGADGTWSIESPTQDQIAEGEYTLTATQTIDGVTSASTSVVFAIQPADDGDDAADGTDGATDGETDGADGTDGGGDDQLPATGADSFITLTAAAGGVILLAGGITLLTLRRRAALIQE